MLVNGQQVTNFSARFEEALFEELVNGLYIFESPLSPVRIRCGTKIWSNHSGVRVALASAAPNLN